MLQPSKGAFPSHAHYATRSKNGTEMCHACGECLAPCTLRRLLMMSNLFGAVVGGLFEGKMSDPMHS